MCGICGTPSTRRAADPERLAEMSGTLVHRGPEAALLEPLLSGA